VNQTKYSYWHYKWKAVCYTMTLIQKVNIKPCWMCYIIFRFRTVSLLDFLASFLLAKTARV